ncbi:MAG: hypothetical protein OXE86_11915 [Alphaproteobacteria bacterium]|nr:hypothetical protein [Alphaproteobacteria bacterium]
MAAVSTPGHTPGHMSLEVRNGSDAVLVTGDAIGNHHVALSRPQWRGPGPCCLTGLQARACNLPASTCPVAASAGSWPAGTATGSWGRTGRARTQGPRQGRHRVRGRTGRPRTPQVPVIRTCRR